MNMYYVYHPPVYCDYGNEEVSGSCQPCQKDFYKESRGNDSCIQCPGNSTTAGQASVSIGNCSVGE